MSTRSLFPQEAERIKRAARREVDTLEAENLVTDKVLRALKDWDLGVPSVTKAKNALVRNLKAAKRGNNVAIAREHRRYKLAVDLLEERGEPVLNRGLTGW